jgi:uncharacterized protein (DUF2249 family)
MCTTDGIDHLDVRPVEPKHRLEAVMSAYDGLSPGTALELIVDHDPRCMYYTLKALRGEATYAFEYLENGPETWKVLVTKRLERQPIRDLEDSV